MISHVEEKMMEKFIFNEIPEEFQEVFFNRMKEGKDATVEGRLLEFADKLDLFYEAFAELKRGNTDREFVSMYQEALKKLLVIPLPKSVEYFKNIILADVITEKTPLILRRSLKKYYQKLKP